MVAPVQDDAEVEISIEDEEAEEEPAKFQRCPGDPTEKELEQHRTTHLPYRSWCRFCVMGRGCGRHHKHTGRKSSIPRIGLDYFYIIDGAIHSRNDVELNDEELEEKRRDGHVLKCVIMRDWDNKTIWAHIIPRKGADEEAYAARILAEDLRWMGHGKIMLRYDNERALKSLGETDDQHPTRGGANSSDYRTR